MKLTAESKSSTSKALQKSDPAKTDLNIVPVESALPHDQQVSLGVWWAESLFTEGQEGSGAGQEEQCWNSVRHSVWLLVEEHRPRWEVRWPHALWCVYISMQMSKLSEEKLL